MSSRSNTAILALFFVFLVFSKMFLDDVQRHIGLPGVGWRANDGIFALDRLLGQLHLVFSHFQLLGRPRTSIFQINLQVKRERGSQVDKGSYCLKPRPNGCNMLSMHATLLDTATTC